MLSFKRSIFRLLNKLLPKLGRIVVLGSENAESNAVEMANSLAIHVNDKVFFIVPKNLKPYFKQLLNRNVRLTTRNSIIYYYLYLTAKYVFSTHGGSPLIGSSKRQKEINIWHGVLYKNIRMLRGKGEEGIHADITVGTSPLSQKMFSEAFGVRESSVFISGYPRNDLMLRAQKDKKAIISTLRPDLRSYNKILFWMPTYRRVPGQAESNWRFGLELTNPFQVRDFDVERFNDLLKAQNTLCLLKPHYFYVSDKNVKKYSNILMIDDEWILKQGITLYHLLGCVDILISDFSSVIIDYILTDRPVVCFCSDLEEYKQRQGLYFEDFEQWLPTKLIQDQEAFFQFLYLLLTSETDPFKEKRMQLKKEFFTYHDDRSAERLIKHIFGDKNYNT